MTKAYSFKPNATERAYLEKRIAETGKTPSAVLHAIVSSYIAFEKDPYAYLLARDAKISDAEKRKAESLLVEKEKQETLKQKIELEKTKAHMRQLSHEPKVDWGPSEGATGLNQEDGFFDPEE